jgi:hypothetical protein
LISEDFDAALPDLGCADRLAGRELCFVEVPAVASSGFDVAAAVSAPAAGTGDGPAKHTKSPVAIIKAERPLALIIMWRTPVCLSPKAK